MSRQTSTLKTSDRRCTLPRVLVLLLCTVCGCATPEREPIRLEAYSWWTQPSERDAFDSVLDIYNRAHDSKAYNGVTDGDAVEVRKLLTARLLANAPPSTFQANAGADLLQWTAMDTTSVPLDNSSRIAPLEALFERKGLAAVLPSDVYEALRAGPRRLPYAVPLNIHRLNVIYYNKAALETYRMKHGRSFLEPEVLCPENVDELLANSDQGLDLKIAVGTGDGFSLTLFALENLLPAVAGTTPYDDMGRTLYDELFRGNLKEEIWRDEVTRALQCMQYLSRSFIREDDMTWASALHRVEAGEAAFSVMGDWANGELKAALQDDGSVDARPFPGSEGTFVFTSDTFPLPTKAPYPKESEDLLETLVSVDAQLAFSSQKGSIPARRDIEPADVERALGKRAAATRADFYDERIHKSIATSGVFPPYYPELSSRLAAMTAKPPADGSIREVVAFIRDTVPLLGRWQDRISTGQQRP